MKSLCAVFAIAGAAVCGPLYESAALSIPPVRTTGFAISARQYLGTTFVLRERTRILDVGGWLASVDSGTLFAVIVQLDHAGDRGVPRSPFADSVLASTTFTATRLNSDVIIPFDITLDPGSYGLIFGTGRFGATSHGGVMPNGEANGVIGVAGTRRLTWDSTEWTNTPNDAQNGLIAIRFFVEGEASPR